MKVILATDHWLSNDGIYVKGYCHTNSKVIDGDSLLKYFSVDTTKDLEQRLKDANGIFAVIINTPQLKAAAIDGTRLYPLHYTLSNGELTITDQPDNILCQENTLNEQGIQDYLTSSFTLAGETLINEISQIKPFHYITYNNKTLQEREYKNFLFKKSDEQSLSEEQLAQTIRQAFTRVMESIRGRQVVVPLSGGYDSRLIATLLYQTGYKNVICYTLGDAESDECTTAIKVCKQFGYKIYQINSTTSQFTNFTQTAEYEQYYRFIGGLSNFTWLFEVPAILTLKREGVLEPNAVFMPGHSGDFLAGSQMYKSLLSDNSSIDAYISAIMNERFIYGYNPNTQKKVKECLLTTINEGYTPMSSFHWFMMQNLLSGSVNNAARVYEFFGYDVRLLYWDIPLMQSMLSLPFSDLYKCNLYRKCLEHHFFKPANVDYEASITPESILKRQKIKNRLRKFIPQRLLKFKPDGVGEWALAKPLMDENPNIQAHTVNQFLLKWYLQKVKLSIKK